MARKRKTIGDTLDYLEAGLGFTLAGIYADKPLAELREIKRDAFAIISEFDLKGQFSKNLHATLKQLHKDIVAAYDTEKGAMDASAAKHALEVAHRTLTQPFTILSDTRPMDEWLRPAEALFRIQSIEIAMALKEPVPNKKLGLG